MTLPRSAAAVLADHVRAPVGHDAARCRAGDPDGELDHLHSLERSPHRPRTLPSRRMSPDEAVNVVALQRLHAAYADLDRATTVWKQRSRSERLSHRDDYWDQVAGSR